MKGIADTGFLVAFGLRDDIHHDWAVDIAGRVTEPLLTCEAVLAETAYKLRSVEFVARVVKSGLVTIKFDLLQELGSISQLADGYGDRHPDLADLCLIRMSELNPKLPVITVDGDFRIYRRNRNEAIPVIMPHG